MIVIPMAGRSQRFLDAGYDRPKYMLPLGADLVFDHSVRSFERYFEDRRFLFITSDREGLEFARARADLLGVAQVDVQMTDGQTAGQAETVEIGLRRAGAPSDTPLTIFNIDTFRPELRLPEFDVDVSGWLEVFRGEGDNWSFVEPDEQRPPMAKRTSEKAPISDLCCTGLYDFSRAEDFFWALEQERLRPQARELYVAPIYNHLLRRGQQVAYHLVPDDEVVFCGTPAEYQALGGRPPQA